MDAYRSTRRRIIAAGLASAGAPWLAPFARAQDAYPSRPIRVVVGHAAGGGVDILARHLGEHIRPLLGQPFVVENRPGANGMIGTQAVAAATPDGYTLLMASAGEIAISPHLYRKMAYDPFKDLQPVTLGTKVPNVLIVHPSVRATTTVELIALVALAASGSLQPILAAALMAGSSLLVIANSLRLERFPAPEESASTDGAGLTTAHV